ncbi:hypothetical protein DFH94DRAFT_104647 [Russula ochroleuca]|uniref:Uncharacterized protein n=1 Tax=Russula ochroleuca TaxID=152965 RepID=A0A9P5MSF9_9AGAM|nr:hypothetical protein DFH94DRAFT_104647 [Russula ochroleuca]
MQFVVALQALAVLALNVAFWASRDDLRRGVPPCPACNRCPRRINSNYCGSSCERWDAQRQQQPQHQRYYPPSGVRPHSLVPSSGDVIWNIPTGHVRCPRCGTTYSPQGRNQPRYETGIILSACPSCGYS